MIKIENFNKECDHVFEKLEFHYGSPTPIVDNTIYTSTNIPIGPQLYGTCECQNCGKIFTLIGDNISDIKTLQEKNPEKTGRNR